MDANSSILKPGSNCWRIEECTRAAFLVDGDAYYSAFRSAVSRAQHSVLILGWDIDSRLRLRRDLADDGLPLALGPFLDRVVERQPGLEVHILTWDFSMVFALEREWMPIFKLGWRTHPRLHFRMDGRHPLGGSHHQKVVVIDDRIAFVGGMDLSRERWDTPAHTLRDARRTESDGVRYPPFHDVQMLVEGPVAGRLGGLARERWRRASGQELRPPPARKRPFPWPETVSPDVGPCRVAIARTEPAFQGRPEIREVERLHLDAFAAARRWIYLENQFLTSQSITEALARRLEEPDGPEVILILPRHSSGWLEQRIMDVLRARAVDRLVKADRHHRLGVFYPVPPEGDGVINVHDKVSIIDDRLLRIGSANLSNRSMGTDSECDLAIDAGNEPGLRATVARFRNRLLGEHLGRPAEVVREATEAESSLLGAIERLRDGRRTLKPSAEQLRHVENGWDMSDLDLVDPERPIDPEVLVERLVDDEQRQPAGRHLMRYGVILLSVALMAAAWRWTPLSELLDVEQIVGALRGLSTTPGAPLLVLAGFLIGGAVSMPVTLLIVATVIVFGLWPGFVYALAGCLISAWSMFWVGQKLGRETVSRFAGDRVNRISQQLARRGILTIAVIRLVPVAPFTIVNIVAGASQIRLRDYMVGTFVGMAPGILAITVFLDRILATVRHPEAENIVLLLLIAGLLVAGAFLLRHLLIRRRRARHDRDRPSDCL